jgi:hypothetical protein
MRIHFTFLLSLSVVASARLVKDANTNDGITLAVSPQCGSATGTATDLNEGIASLSTFKTIVSFGVSYR